MQDRPTQTVSPGLAALAGVADEPGSLSHREILRFLRRYAFVIAGITAAVSAIAALYAMLATPIYTAHSQILIESRLPQALRQQLGEVSLALDSPQIESQIAVLRSEQVARWVVEKLQLAKDPEFMPAPSRWGRWFKTETEADIAAARAFAVTAFQNNLDARRYNLSYVLDINFSSKDREKAALISNTVADAYLSDQLGVKVGAARQASEWGEQQVSRLRELMNASARAVQEFKVRRDYRLGPSAEQLSAGAAPDKHDKTTLEELEATATAYKKIYESNLQAHVEAVERQALQFNDARVITHAAIPLEASFPKTRLILLFGLSMGALLGLAAALVLHAFDQSIVTRAQIDDGTGLPCLGVVPPNPTPSRLRAFLRPALDRLGWSSDPALDERVAAAAYRLPLDAPGSRAGAELKAVRFAVNRLRKAEDLAIIGIGALEQGAGSARIVWNLGGLFTGVGVRTVVVDLDGDQYPCMPATQGCEGMAEILLGTLTAESAVIAGHQGTPDVIPAGLPTNRAVITDIAQSEPLAALLAHLGSTYDLVLVVLPSLSGGGDAVAFAAHTDAVIVMAQGGVTPVPRLNAVVGGLRSAGCKVLGALLASADTVVD